MLPEALRNWCVQIREVIKASPYPCQNLIGLRSVTLYKRQDLLNVATNTGVPGPRILVPLRNLVKLAKGLKRSEEGNRS